MATFHMIEPNEIPEFPPHAERLRQLQRSGKGHQHVAWVNAHLVPGEPNEPVALAEAGGAEEAMYATLTTLREGADEVAGVMNIHGTDSNQARDAYRDLTELWRSAFAARQAFVRAQDAWWDRHGDHA
ncbi:MAG: hypothetical protein OXH41_00030 [Chloroflexi bacterium]|nr:hypothetical protein [Chloroflexota bacterium]